jgi:hypothetical protein
MPKLLPARALTCPAPSVDVDEIYTNIINIHDNFCVRAENYNLSLKEE